MRPSRRRRCAVRSSGFEIFEPRIAMSASSLSALAADSVVDTQQTTTAQTTGSSGSQLTGPAYVRAAYGLTGQGQTVAVIDTGIDYNHTALGQGFGPDYTVVGGYDFTGDHASNPSNAYDDGPDGGHGTSVAGIIAANDGVHEGVAPNVDLVSLRVFNDQGQSSFTWVDEALQWVIANRNSFRYPITTVNMSLGETYNGETPPAGAALEKDLAQLNADGIFVAVAAGNDFSSYLTSGLSYPAASPSVVPVMSVDNNGQLSSFSQRDSRAIAAPGQAILSSIPNYAGNPNGPDDDFSRSSGTSMAAPYVAGAAVLIRQAYAEMGVQNVNESTIYQDMVNTADTVHDSATGANYNVLNLGRAIDAILSPARNTSTNSTPVSHTPAASTPGLYNSTQSVFFLRQANAAGVADNAVNFGPANANLIPVCGDWTGGGATTIGLYNPTNSLFYLRNSNTSGVGDNTIAFGPAGSGWEPIVGDWNGDGTDTVGLYNPATGTFYLRNSNTSGVATTVFTFMPGHSNWIPIAGDWDGNGTTTVGLYDPVASKFYLKNSNTSGAADLSFSYGMPGAGWQPIAGNWNHNAVDTVGLYVPGSSAFYLKNTNSGGVADIAFVYGPAGAGWKPVVGSWNVPLSSAYKTAAATASAPTSSVVRAASLGTENSTLMTQSVTDGSGVGIGNVSSLSAGASPPEAVCQSESGQSGSSIDPRAVDQISLSTTAQRLDWLEGLIDEGLGTRNWGLEG